VCISEVAACTKASFPFSCCTGSGTGTCSPQTSNLFSLIAWKESSYHHFLSGSANGFNGALWPNESMTDPAGQYIGVMQAALRAVNGNTLASPMDTAWNWLVNTQVAQNIFAQKINFVIAAVQAAVKLHPTLAALTQAQLEQMVLLQYGGFIEGKIKSPDGQYYTPNPSGGWHWALNNTVSADGQNYVTGVIKAAPPTSTTCP
jgi:hypothetical protein